MEGCLIRNNTSSWRHSLSATITLHVPLIFSAGQNRRLDRTGEKDGRRSPIATSMSGTSAASTRAFLNTRRTSPNKSTSLSVAAQRRVRLKNTRQLQTWTAQKRLILRFGERRWRSLQITQGFREAVRCRVTKKRANSTLSS